MFQELKFQLSTAILTILTIATAASAVINFQQQHKFRLADDGAVWVDRGRRVEALHIDPDGPAAKSGLKNGDMLLKINGAATAPRPDPKDAKLTVVDFEFLGILEPPTTLREIKDSGLFPDWALVRQSRLSTMSVPPAFVEWMRKRYGKTKI